MKKTLLFATLLCLSSLSFGKAKITIINGNAPGVGFNDATAKAPLGGNPGTTIGEQRLNVFKKAAEIQVLATFEPLTCTTTSAVLGSAGTRQIFFQVPNADPNLLISGALANNTVLPAGLSLSSGGQITGTPTVTGTSSFTVKVTDGGSPQQSATKQLSITVTAPPTFYSIWSASTVPGTVDAGPDSSVELGVKFKADVNGSITGIRFYKSSANTGTHVANLWSSSGALLASVTFTNETASGWQQVNFASPVSITAGTVYVASYHLNTGHYSMNQNYFATAGVDNSPLHALQNGVSGVNGVFAYGATSIFPSGGFNSSNYWVDVVFNTP